LYFKISHYRRDLWLDHGVVQIGVEHDDGLFVSFYLRIYVWVFQSGSSKLSLSMVCPSIEVMLFESFFF